MASDPRTLAAYDREAARYLERARDWPAEPWVAKIANRLSPGARILDFGCGPGGAATHFAELGFEVEAVDGSSEMVRIAREQTGLNVRLMRFDELDDGAHYDAVWSSFALLHLAKADFPGVLERIARALRPNGTLMISMKTGDGEDYDSLDRFYAYYTPAELTGHLERAGFAVIETEEGEGVGLAGTSSGLIWILAQKTEDKDGTPQ
ncbi:MAG: class I SAM-dependent methyltransferase [Pseudomonadota bacterium]